MAETNSVVIDGGVVMVAFTDRSDGDFRPLPADIDTTSTSSIGHGDYFVALEQRRRKIVDQPWTWLRQVHGNRAVYVSEAGAQAGVTADGALTTAHWSPLAITTADCAPVVLVAEGGFAVIHAGWRGLVAGIINDSASQLRAVGGTPVASLVGPCIAAGAYEFGADDLAVAAAALGDQVRAETDWGKPALDVPAAVSGACERAGWMPPTNPAPCTSDERWYSHRTRADTGRQATVAWLSSDTGPRPSPVPPLGNGFR